MPPFMPPIMLPSRQGAHRRQRTAMALALLALLALLPAAAAAHPHVFIDAVTTFQFDRKRVTGVELRWHFDDLYSAVLIRDFDANRDGVFDPAEVVRVQAGAFAALKSSGYFTHLFVDKQQRAIETVREFHAYILGGRVFYQFVIAVNPAVDPVKQRLALGVFDPGYYVAFDMEPPRPVLFSGMARPSCQYQLYLDEEHPIYFGAVSPHTIRLDCIDG